MGVAFFGCFRAGELCLLDGVVFQPKLHLTVSDVVVNRVSSYITVHLKQSKTDTLDHGIDVNIGCSNTSVCAYCLMQRYLDQHPDPRPSSPLFIDCNFSVLRKSYFVATTKLAVACEGYDSSQYSGHSFRAGSATDGAAAGFSSWELKMLGRWSSEAYNVYLRDPTLAVSFSQRLAVPDVV